MRCGKGLISSAVSIQRLTRAILGLISIWSSDLLSGLEPAWTFTFTTLGCLDCSSLTPSPSARERWECKAASRSRTLMLSARHPTRLCDRRLRSWRKPGGNHDERAGTLPMPPILTFREAGVNVFAGNDDIRDSWWPYGDADMLQRVMLIGYRSGFYTDEELSLAFDLATINAAHALGLSEYGLRIGAPADLVALPVRQVPEAVVVRPAERTVFKSGQIVASNGSYLGRQKA